jgi:hypothetical protein
MIGKGIIRIDSNFAVIFVLVYLIKSARNLDLKPDYAMFHKLRILSPNSFMNLYSLMIFSCGKTRLKMHKLLTRFVKQCAFSI